MWIRIGGMTRLPEDATSHGTATWLRSGAGEAPGKSFRLLAAIVRWLKGSELISRHDRLPGTRP